MRTAFYDPRRLLAFPRAYASCMSWLGGDAGMKRFVEEFLRPLAGDRILDLGCGPGRIVPYLPFTEYWGIDSNESYLRRARALYGKQGARFERLDPCGDHTSFEGRDFDLMVASGLLHHLPDAQARRVFAFCRDRLRPGGRLVTLDCVRVGQAVSPASKFVGNLLVSLDRGRFVRTKEAYLDLAQREFPAATASLQGDLLRVPYSHAILECVK